MAIFICSSNTLVISLLVFVYAVPSWCSLANDPVSSASHDKQGWYSAPNFRGTADVIWSCLLTIFLCCWTAIHPTIPAPNATWTQKCLDRTAILCLGIMAPEVLIVLAGDEYIVAGKLSKSKGESWTIENAFYAIMGGYAERKETDNGSEKIVPLEYQDIILMMEKGRLEPSMLLSQADIRDKGKADNIVKALTLLQVMWLLIQTIARCVQHLPLSTLELSTLAYVPCAMLIYFFWWNKPYDVGVRTIVKSTPSHTSLQRTKRIMSKEAVKEGYSWGDLSDRYHDHPYAMTRLFWDASVGACMPSDIVKRLMASFVFLMFGSVHLAGWNFNFPSRSEQLGWRICSLLISASFPVSWGVTAVLLRITSGVWWTGLEKDDFKKKYGGVRRVCIIIQVFAVVVYSVARLYLLAEAFIGLRAVPKEVYRTPEWTNFVPHLG